MTDNNINRYPKPSWATHQVVRMGGLVEDICKEHSVGHPNAAFLKEHDPEGDKGLGVHGCCGCCCKGDDY